MSVIHAASEDHTQRAVSRGHIERFSKTLSDCIQMLCLADKMRVSAIHAGHISTCNVAPTPQDSWQINLLLGAEPDPSLAGLEKFGFRNEAENIASIRYAFDGGYSITQVTLGLPGAWERMEWSFESHQAAFAHILRIIANIDFNLGISRVLKETAPRRRKRWFDFLLVDRAALRNVTFDERIAVIMCGDLRIAIPLTQDAREEMLEYFSDSNVERKFGGFVLSKTAWLTQLEELHKLCRGSVLYMDSLSG